MAITYLGDRRYQLLDLIGRGQLCHVYRATDTRLNAMRAIKMLPPMFGAHPAILERFLREGGAAASIDHPHIATVFDLGIEGGQSYMVLELLTGGTLRQLRGHCALGDAVRWGSEVLWALEVAHDRGVIHRDIRPANILLSEYGQAKLTDFGMVRVLAASDSAGVTQSGQGMGYWPYAPPEQLSSARTVDARADLYAMGATLFTLVTGQKPQDMGFSEADFEALPASLAEVIRTATAWEVEDRYPDATAMRAALKQVQV